MQKMCRIQLATGNAKQLLAKNQVMAAIELLEDYLLSLKQFKESIRLNNKLVGICFRHNYITKAYLNDTIDFDSHLRQLNKIVASLIELCDEIESTKFSQPNDYYPSVDIPYTTIEIKISNDAETLTNEKFGRFAEIVGENFGAKTVLEMKYIEKGSTKIGFKIQASDYKQLKKIKKIGDFEIVKMTEISPSETEAKSKPFSQGYSEAVLQLLRLGKYELAKKFHQGGDIQFKDIYEAYSNLFDQYGSPIHNWAKLAAYSAHSELKLGLEGVEIMLIDDMFTENPLNESEGSAGTVVNRVVKKYLMYKERLAKDKRFVRPSKDGYSFLITVPKYFQTPTDDVKDDDLNLTESSHLKSQENKK